MGVKRRVKLPAFSGIGANQTATMDIPVGPRYHQIILSGDNAASSTAITTHLREMRLKVNGKVQRVMTASELDVLNKLNGAQYGIQGNTSGGLFQLPIFFAEPWRKSVQAQDGLAWATGDVSSFQLEVDLATAPDSLYAIAIVDNSIVKDEKGREAQQPMGAITKWFRTQIPFVGTTADFSSLPKRDFYQQISMFDTAITRATVKVDNNVIHDLLKEENDGLLTHYGMTPVSTRYDIVFDHDDLLSSSLPMVFNGFKVGDFLIQIASGTATARNIPTIYQMIGAPE